MPNASERRGRSRVRGPDVNQASGVRPGDKARQCHQETGWRKSPQGRSQSLCFEEALPVLMVHGIS